MIQIAFANRQRDRALDLRLLRKVANEALRLTRAPDGRAIASADIGFNFVTNRRMAELNEHFLQHDGPTDVITFDYALTSVPLSPPGGEGRGEGARSIRGGGHDSQMAEREHEDKYPGSAGLPAGLSLCGEVFICVAVAIRQARAFETNWQEELARYLVHGILHLCGYDDRTAAVRRPMKREEDRLVRALARSFCLSRLGRTPTLRT